MELGHFFFHSELSKNRKKVAITHRKTPQHRLQPHLHRSSSGVRFRTRAFARRLFGLAEWPCLCVQRNGLWMYMYSRMLLGQRGLACCVGVGGRAISTSLCRCGEIRVPASSLLCCYVKCRNSTLFWECVSYCTCFGGGAQFARM